MPKLSEQAHQAAQELYQLDQKSKWFGGPRLCSDIIARLVELADYGEPAAIPCICRFLFSKEPTVRDAAAEAVSSILSGLAPLGFLQLADALNMEYGWSVGQEWSNLKPSSVRKLAKPEDGSLFVPLLGLLSFHRSGYVREEAVKLLAKVSDGSEAPFLLIRQNDWVAAISRCAQAAVKERLAYAYSEHWFNNLDLIAHLPQFGRNDLSHVTDATFAQLLEPQHEERLRTLLKSGDRKTVRRFVKRSCEMPGSHCERVAQSGIASDDAVVRLWSARVLLASAPDSILLSRLINDGFAPVRREAYVAWAASNSTDAFKVWTEAAFDRSGGIRDLARFQLRKLGHVNLRGQYLARLQDNADDLSALMGLSECSREQDAQLLRKYSVHDRPRYRCVAIGGLARLLGEPIADDLLAWLADESPAVAKQAARSLQGFAAAVDGGKLWEVLMHSVTDSGRTSCLRLFYEMGKWKSLPWLVQAFTLENLFVSEQAEQLARAWINSNRVFTKPSQEEKQAITDAYANAREVLPEQFADELQSRLPFRLEDGSDKAT